MEAELNDTKYQTVLAKNLTAGSAISRRAANLVLQRNGVDVNWATDQAKKWKAGQLPAQQPTQQPAQQPRAGAPIPSKPELTGAQAHKLMMALAGTSSIEKRVATLYCKEHGIPVEEFRVLARRTVAEEERHRAGWGT